MSAEETDNPYSGPGEGTEITGSPERKRPGLVTILIVTAGCIVASVCGFFISCLGLDIVANTGVSLDLGTVLGWSFVGAMVAFVVAWFVGMKIMLK